MHLTLLESDRNFIRSAELATLSIAAHVVVLGILSGSAAGTFRLPSDEREVKAMLLLPPDRAEPAERTADLPLPGRPGSGFDEASPPPLPDDGVGMRLEANAAGGSKKGERSGAKSDAPVGPAPFLAVKVYTALEVDQMVERFESSAAPVYPPELSARGIEGAVEATYVVDITGRVDTTTITVVRSDHPRFTQSVRAALSEARFRPAKRRGMAVRQLVAQRFRFKQAETSPAAQLQLR